MPGTNDFSVLTLTSDELPRLRDLMSLFGEAFDEPATYVESPPSDDYLMRLLGSDAFIAVVGLVGDAVVGGLIAYELHKPEQERSEIFIYDLAVAEDQRRRGIATALIGETRRLARERGAWVVFLEADVGDEAPIALYTKLGTREDVINFDITP